MITCQTVLSICHVLFNFMFLKHFDWLLRAGCDAHVPHVKWQDKSGSYLYWPCQLDLHCTLILSNKVRMKEKSRETMICHSTCMYICKIVRWWDFNLELAWRDVRTANPILSPPDCIFLLFKVINSGKVNKNTKYMGAYSSKLFQLHLLSIKGG